jgi:hypothetical protein
MTGYTPSWVTRHWRTYNVLRRVAGIGFLAVGSLLAGNAVWWLVHPASAMPVNGVPTPGVWPKLAALALSAAAVGFGARAVRAYAYRPDLGDAHAFASPQEAADQARHREPRNWWTGDPLPSRDRPRPDA